MRSRFKPAESVVHPNHGTGCVGRTEDREIAGRAGRYLVVEFTRTMLTLSIPEAKIKQSGLRRLSSPMRMRSALAVLPDPPVGECPIFCVRAALGH